MSKKYRWGTMVPLIGGSAIGCSQATGTLPQFHFSFDGFDANDAGILNYWKDANIPYYHIDSQEVPLTEKRFQNIDFVNSVCPCAALARINTSTGDKVGGHAPQNQWMYKSAEFVLENIKPTVYWGENAPALNMDAGKPVVETLVKIGKKYGYSFSIYKTSTLLHGLPQKRERCFYFFWKGDQIPILNYFDRERKTYKDFILDVDKRNLSLMDEFLWTENVVATDFIPLKYLIDRSGLSYEEFIDTYSTDTVTTTLGLIDKEGIMDELLDYMRKNCADAKKPNKKTWVEFLEYVKEKWDDDKGVFYNGPIIVKNYAPAVISKNAGNLIHPTEDRHLNYREILCLMGMPDDFIPIDYTGRHKYCTGQMIGQNVPVNTARDVATQVLRFIDGDKTLRYTSVKNGYYLQNNLSKTDKIISYSTTSKLF